MNQLLFLDLRSYFHAYNVFKQIIKFKHEQFFLPFDFRANCTLNFMHIICFIYYIDFTQGGLITHQS